MTSNPISSYFGGMKNTLSRDHQHLLTLPRGSPSNTSLLVPSVGSLSGSCSPLVAVTISSPVHLFPKGSRYIPRHHSPGPEGKGRELQLTFTIF